MISRFPNLCPILFFFALISSICGAGTVSSVQGKWHGSWEGRMGALPITLELTQEGHKLTGKIIHASKSSPVIGAISGNAISFTVNFAGPRPFTILFKGMIDGDSIKGTSRAQNVGESGAYLGHGGEIVQPDRPWTAKREPDDQQQTAKHKP